MPEGAVAVLDERPSGRRPALADFDDLDTLSGEIDEHADQRGADDPLDGPLIVNKDELARLLNCSIPFLTKLIRNDRDFPVEVRGRSGVEWQFDVDKVRDYVEVRREEERRAAEARADRVAQCFLPGFEDQAPTDANGLTPSQRLALAKAQKAERENALAEGHLIAAAELRTALKGTFGHFGKFLDALPAQLGRSCGLAEPAVAELRIQLGDARRRLVADLQDYLRGQPEAGNDA